MAALSLVSGAVWGTSARVFLECMTGGRRALTVTQIREAGDSDPAEARGCREELGPLPGCFLALPTTPIMCGQGLLASRVVSWWEETICHVTDCELLHLRPHLLTEFVTE